MCGVDNIESSLQHLKSDLKSTVMTFKDSGFHTALYVAHNRSFSVYCSHKILLKSFLNLCYLRTNLYHKVFSGFWVDPWTDQGPRGGDTPGLGLYILFTKIKAIYTV